jgi:hypothetical protein
MIIELAKFFIVHYLLSLRFDIFLIDFITFGIIVELVFV